MSMRFAGCDLGRASVAFAVVEVEDDSSGAGPEAGGSPEAGRWSGREVAVSSLSHATHGGRYLELFKQWYAANDVASCAGLGVTGSYADLLDRPAMILPEDACQREALDLEDDLPDQLNLISVGARGCSVIARSRRVGVTGSGSLHYRFVENDKCSSGSGENMVRLARRFGMNLEEADQMALKAESSVPITARCSVFAKSELTHFANQGRPVGDLLKGYFHSVARNARGLLERARVDGPVYLIGGCSRIESFVSSLRQVLGDEVLVLPRALGFEALGAAVLAAEQHRRAEMPALPVSAEELVRPRRRSFALLEPARTREDRVTYLPPEPVSEAERSGPLVLGLDLGSTGSKAVLTSVATGAPVRDAYDQTRGNPIDATHRLLRHLLEDGPLDVRAIGITGSGRQAVATLLRAVFPEASDRLVVVNEIVAHAQAAMRCDPEGGKDLSIVEIGGQDAKFIQISGGKIVESDLNQACSAGTGSFLEEQARLHGIESISEMVEMATKADRPPDLGQMCTVFVAEAASDALQAGFCLDDIFAGFQYSVIHNYINRVKGQRAFGATVFFQGKPASNPSLAWTLAAVTDHPVIVPANPGAMGAWGIGLGALEQIEGLEKAEPLDLEAVLRTHVVGSSELRCMDAKCGNLCTIDQTTVEVGDERKKVLSGGVCAKYELASSDGRVRMAKAAYDPFAEREALVGRYFEERPGAPVIAIPRAVSLFDIMPWLATLVSKLGFSPRLVSSDQDSLAVGEQTCYSFDACGPVKIGHAICNVEADFVLFPRILHVFQSGGVGGRTCPMEQALPVMVRRALGERGIEPAMLEPKLDFEGGWASREVLRSLMPMAERLGIGRRQIREAVAAAARAQQEYEVELQAIGRTALEYGRRHGHPIVLVGGPLHVIYERSINTRIPHLIRENGAMAIPVDCMPVDEDVPVMHKVYWNYASRLLRASVAARRAGDVFPLLVTSFGCGAASLTEPVFQDLMSGYPYTILESDGHSGAAGFVTRIQAFLHTIDQYRKNGGSPQVSGVRLADMDEPPWPHETMDRDSRYVIFSMADQAMPFVAAVYRSFGFDAVAGVADYDAFIEGKKDCSGKECVPYQIIWGAFRRYLQENPPDRRTVLLVLSGETPCRNGMFELKDKISAAKLGYGDLLDVEYISPYAHALTVIKIWWAVVTWDLLFNLFSYHVAVEAEPGLSEALYREYCTRAEALLERPVSKLAWEMGRDWRALQSLLREASADFAGMRRRPTNGLKTVLLSGDIYTRLDALCRDGLIERLGSYGLQTIVEPASTVFEYFTHVCTRDAFGSPKDPFWNTFYRIGKKILRHKLYEVVQEQHPWMPISDLGDILHYSTQQLDATPQGEAPVTVGSVLHAWEEKRFDGVVLISPWGCAPALVSESILRHYPEIPALYIYTEGTPIDERRLRSFAFQLQRS